MANVIINISANAYAGLVADTTAIYEGLNINQIFNVYANVTFRPIGANFVGGSCNSKAKAEEAKTNIIANMSFNAWFAASKQILDGIETALGGGGAPSEYLSTFATFLIGANKLKVAALSPIWAGTGNVIPAVVPAFRVAPIFDSFTNQIFNSNISSTSSYAYTARFSPSLVGVTGIVQLVNLVSGVANGSGGDFTVGADGVATATITTGTVVPGTAFGFNVTSFNLFSTSVYASTINSSIFYNNLASSIFVPTIVGV